MLGVPRSSLYYARQHKRPQRPRAKPRSALSEQERRVIRDMLNSPRFQDQPPRQVFAGLLDDGIYLCSWRTMYRILAKSDEVRERRNQLRHPQYSKPELLATAPNQLWSWDIAKLKGPTKWTYYYLYVILDVFSRYAVGWMIAEREAAYLAKTLISETCIRQDIQRNQLTLHADRGSSMRSKSVALLLSELGVTKTHSRPYTATDNPYSEAQFKTTKYHSTFPKRFETVQNARRWARSFFKWYNHEHYHTGLNLMTPASVYYGYAETLARKRNQTLQAAFRAHPERFVRGIPTTLLPPMEVWINKP